MNIVILDAARVGSDISFEKLKELGNLTVYQETNSNEEALKRTKDADILIIDQFPINEKSIGNASHLKFVTMTSTGTNFVDFNYTNRKGITVANIKNYSTFSVAQHTIALYLSLSEKLFAYHEYVSSNKYINDYSNSSFKNTFHDLSHKTWGIVGMGQIGTQVAKIVSSFGCEVIYHSVSGHPHCKEYKHVSLDTLLKSCDVVSVHTPLTSQTENLFSTSQFSRMKQNSYFINVARGGLVDEQALTDALNNRIIAGAALDVLKSEPMAPDCPLLNVKDSNQLLITPHIAWASVESRQQAVEEVYLNTQAFLNGIMRNVITK